MKVKVPFQMSPKQRRAMNDEIEAQIQEARVRDSDEYDAAVLWALHLCFGFGKKRLRKFYDFYCSLYLQSGKWKYGRSEIEMLEKIGVDICGWNHSKR